MDSLLKTELNRPDGLADAGTLILDPATGTGGFLLSVLDHIRESVIQTYGTGEWTQYINAELVRRIFGFELLVAPYTIAHLKLSLFLRAQGWRADERLRIYLTNTLEQPTEMQPPLPFAEFISEEANAALSVKRDEPLLVILGNPPYQRSSANPSRDADGSLNFIGHLMENYRSVDGAPMSEQNLQALQDDYVKFIRWAQWRIDRNGEGIVGYIVNNNFLDAPTVRGMRQNLLESFNAIYLLNLHGSNRRTEAIPTAQRNENVFDISQGVCILLCVKERDNSMPAKVYYADTWGSREERYNTLSATDVHSTGWCELQPTSRDYLFVPQATDYNAEYKQNEWEITDIFQSSSIGIVTARDKLTIHRTSEQVRETVTDFVSLSVDEAREKYRLRNDTRDWKVHLAQGDLRNHPDVEQHIAPIYYRPFDPLWTYYTGKTKGFHCMPRPENMSHLLLENLALCVCRIVKSPAWQHALIADNITENCYISNTTSESGHVFPLYLYPNPEELGLSTGRSLNFKPAFLNEFSDALGLPKTEPFNLPKGVSPEEILAYIYAVLYSPTYRERYYEFLKYDFPRIPLPRDIEQFRSLAALGQRLIDSHLLKMCRDRRSLLQAEGLRRCIGLRVKGMVLFQRSVMWMGKFGLIRLNVSRMCLSRCGSMRLVRIRCVRSGFEGSAG